MTFNMIFRQQWVAFVTLAAVLLSFSVGAGAKSTLTGAGASFPYPLYSKWISEYQKTNTGVAINYQSIGSGAGVRQVLQGTVDFGASDSPMTSEEHQKAKAPVVQLPMTIGAIVVSYNIPGLTQELSLDQELLSEIFLGTITKWDDPKILAINPDLKLELTSLKKRHKFISTVHRSDGSGTTAVFTNYLSDISENWKAKVGAAKSVKWPVGLGAKGNEGVTGMIKNTPGSIGYVELTYALTNNLKKAKLKNKAGEFVSPEIVNIQKAVSENIPDDFILSLLNSEKEGAYPIVAFTYLLVPSDMPTGKLSVLAPFIKWSLEEGQGLSKQLHYVPLPTSISEKVVNKVSELQQL